MGYVSQYVRWRRGELGGAYKGQETIYLFVPLFNHLLAVSFDRLGDLGPWFNLRLLLLLKTSIVSFVISSEPQA